MTDSTLAKICGLSRRVDVEAADMGGAHMLGFILAPSPRRITPEAAREISEGVRAKRVAVTVNASPDELVNICEIFAPDFIQFHGDEPPEHVLRMGAQLGVGTIKAVGIRDDADMKRAELYSACDYLLYDAKPPKGAEVRGGHGVAIDWEVIRSAPTPARFLLAGGLSPDNVARAVAATRAPMVDVSSGVEVSPGVKDPDLIRRFIKAAQGESVHG